MDEVEQLAESLYRRTREAQGYRQPGNITLYPAKGYRELPQDAIRRENYVKAIRQALADDVIRIGEGSATLTLDQAQSAG